MRSCFLSITHMVCINSVCSSSCPSGSTGNICFWQQSQLTLRGNYTGQQLAGETFTWKEKLIGLVQQLVSVDMSAEVTEALCLVIEDIWELSRDIREFTKWFLLKGTDHAGASQLQHKLIFVWFFKYDQLSTSLVAPGTTFLLKIALRLALNFPWIQGEAITILTITIKSDFGIVWKWQTKVFLEKECEY